MPKAGEIDYVRNLEDRELPGLLNKPYADPRCGEHLVQLGAVLSLLPPPPARLLDLGCGTGWTSALFARRGYDVVGVDLCPDMIAAARGKAEVRALPNLRFVVSDYEGLGFRDEFDVAVFYDALHHAVDEAAAVRCAYRALKPAGVCLTSEPGEGHSGTDEARGAVRRFNVTEKDMPPEQVIAVGRAAGFRESRIYPMPVHLLDLFYPRDRRSPGPRAKALARLTGLAFQWLVPFLHALSGKGIAVWENAFIFKHLFHLLRRQRRLSGLVLLRK